MFKTVLIDPLLTMLNLLAPKVGGYGMAIIILTLLIRLVLLPLTMPSMKAAVKIRELQPEIDKLKKQFANDKMGLQQAQVELFKKHQVNPVSGCLPNILQFVILIAFYQVINAVIKPDQTADLTRFLWLNITQPDPLYLLPVVAALTQLILGLMLLPATSTAAEQSLAATAKKDNEVKQADDITAMAQTMQQQMIFMMPLMTLFLALRFPSGLTLYWVITTVFSIVQQYFVSGWGGLPASYAKITRRLKK